MNEMPTFFKQALWILLLITNTSFAEQSTIKVFAAASLTEVMTTLAKQYSAQHSVQVQTVYGGSGMLAKQLEQGAPADLFISADVKWMDYLKGKHLLQEATVRSWLGNRLVMVIPVNQVRQIVPERSASERGYWCTGDTISVPVGIYAKQALTYMGWWEKVKDRLVSTQDVRATLSLVEREECDIGIVYATDALVSTKVKIAGEFPQNSHEPIVYPIAVMTQASSSAQGFYDYLQTVAARKVLTQFGFVLVSTDQGLK